MNPFEAGQRKVIPAVLVYARSGDQVLMVHRNASTSDYHLGKWNGLGGKLELDESPLEAARRELREESGIDLPDDKFQVLGTLQFPCFKPHKNEDWWVTVFHADCGPVPPELAPCTEGQLHWVTESKLLDLPLWAGDRLFLPYVLSRAPFLGTIWYAGEQVARSWIQPLA